MWCEVGNISHLRSHTDTVILCMHCNIQTVWAHSWWRESALMGNEAEMCRRQWQKDQKEGLKIVLTWQSVPQLVPKKSSWLQQFCKLVVSSSRNSPICGQLFHCECSVNHALLLNEQVDHMQISLELNVKNQLANCPTPEWTSWPHADFPWTECEKPTCKLLYHKLPVPWQSAAFDASFPPCG